MARRPKTLVALIGETRGAEVTADSFRINLLDALDADLALCVKAGEPPNPLYEWARFVWTFPESGDWSSTYDEMAGGRHWRALLGFSDFFLDGLELVDDAERPGSSPPSRPTSDPILHFYRHLLKQSLERDDVLGGYDWLVVTRSDFLWPLPHPDVRLLGDRRLYTLDGEQYGGVCDRHFLIPRRFAPRYLTVTEPIFTQPAELKLRIEETMAERDWFFLNSERFLAMRLWDLGLWRRVRYLPYFPYLVRPASGVTGWSIGELDQELGLYVKYPAERDRSEMSRRYVRDQASWKRYLAPIRGAPRRYALRKAYRERGLYERNFRRRDPLLRVSRRAVAIARSWFRRSVDTIDRTAAGLGRLLRHIPGLPALLDARVRRMRRRAERRERKRREERTSA
jgi:hypothetical protein